MKENTETIGIKVIKNYIKAFNERNSNKMADLFNFPHVRFANDSVSVISRSEYLNNQDKDYILLGILSDCCDNIKSQSSLSHF